MWTKRICLLSSGIICLLACSLLQSPSPGTTDSGENAAEPQVIYELFDESPAPDKFTVVRVGKSKEKLPDILRAEAQKAFDMGRAPFVEFYAVWCLHCSAIHESLGDERMIDAFTGTYIVKLDLDYWKEKLSGTGLYVRGIPAFYEIDANGKPTGRMITGAAWGEDIPENIAPPMKEFFNESLSEN